MKISASKLHTLLIAGENAAIEYKRCGEGPKADTFESICAFLNKTGGVVILGVEDDGTVVGLPPKGVEAMNKNPIIANFFHQIGLADELGSGVRNLYRFTKLYSGATPLFAEDDIFRIAVPLVAAAKFNETLNATLKLNDTLKSDTVNVATNVALNVALKLSVQEKAVLRQIQKDATVSQAEIAERLHLSRLHVYRIIKRLKSLNVIVREGSKKTGHWKIVKGET